MSRVQATFKAEVVRSYFHRIENAILSAVEDALDRTIAHGVRVAKKHAPVRKVTKGGHQVTRALSDVEIAELPDFVKKGLNPVSGNFLRTGLRPRRVTRRSLAGFLQPNVPFRNARKVDIDRTTGAFSMADQRMNSHLSARGRYDLETGRGVFIRRHTAIRETDRFNPRTAKTERLQRIEHSYTATLGGRLRGEIYGTMFGGNRGGVMHGEVRSPTEYARYVEFPTSRTAAQPYMRPARAAMADRLPREMTRALNRVAENYPEGR